MTRQRREAPDCGSATMLDRLACFPHHHPRRAVGSWWERRWMTSLPAEDVKIESLSAVTLVTADLPRARAFYESLGFKQRGGNAEAHFLSFAAGSSFLNLLLQQNRPQSSGWGRVIFHVSDVDALYARVLRSGLSPEAAPRDAEWGERYFHLRDPDGHELSFAQPLRAG
jgi:catechol 2,3-dioxygenase-like lactoylglutathione lyase family enzyme